ncbi:MAG TPA: M20/M25/M40 family metallo-hydrolase [Vicinamibacterales bacterium]|nr:M20/M25/M40 family metallo-hydrolase [Vicinamibacterales bacterium]
MRFRFRSRLLFLFLLTAPFSTSGETPSEDGAWVNAYRDAAARIIGDAMSSTFAWDRLALMGDTFGHRLSGSKGLEDAIQWAVAEMKADGLENVHSEPVKVPHWVRGRESAEITSPRPRPLVMLGLGNSIGTPADGIEADVLVVRSFEDLDAHGDRVKGRIVLYNVAFTNYSETVLFRGNGPSRAAAHGAVAVLVRSVGPAGLRLPHTGALRYAEGVPQIPAAAITTEDADLLQRMQDRGTTARVRLRMEAKFLADADSFNVVGELRGRERPEEVVVVGGHIDSWDVGTGSTDDGGGCVVTWEALRILKKLNLRPRRTVRVVLWTNEENGTRGANAYRDRYRDQLANHVLMLESDSGVLRPSSFGFTGSDAARTRIKEIAALLRGIQLDRIVSPGEGADIGPSVQAANIPAMSLEADGNYFLIHHTPADTIDKIDPMDMSRASAAIAVIAYVVAEMPERLK